MTKSNSSAKRSIRNRGPWAILSLVLLGAAGIGACDGGSGFGTGPTSDVLQVDTLIVPEAVRAGRMLDIRVVASGPQEITQINVGLRLAQERDIPPVEVDPARTSVTKDISIALDEEVLDTLLVVRVTATDETGAVSAIVEDTVPIADATAPTVTATSDRTTAGGGDSVTVQVVGEDNIALSGLGVAMLTPTGDTLQDTLVVFSSDSRPKVDTATFSLVVPDTLNPMVLTIVGFAFDHTALPEVSPGVPLQIIDTRAPQITIHEPLDSASYPLGSSLRVIATLADAGSGVVSARMVGLAFRGDTAQATDEWVTRYSEEAFEYTVPLVRADSVERILEPASDTTKEAVHLIVEAADSSGNVAADTILIFLGGPRVEILNPVTGDSAQAGGNISVSLYGFDPEGLTELSLDYVTNAGADTTTYALCCGEPQYDTVFVDQVLALPASTGEVELIARARNLVPISASTKRTLNIVSAAAVPGGDATGPSLSVDVSAEPRLEISDDIVLTVQASDNVAIDTLGVTVIGTHTAFADTLVYDSILRGIDITGPYRKTFAFDTEELYARIDALAPDTVQLPDTIRLTVHAFAVDKSGNCSAAVFGGSADQQQTCGTTTVAGTSYRIAPFGTPTTVEVLAVSGHTILLPAGGEIADAVVDEARDRLYLANIAANRIDVIDLATLQTTQTIAVGSEPWGLTIDNTGDTLIVANSGGKNISFVDLVTQEEARRLLIPEQVLFEVSFDRDEVENLKYATPVFYGFSDRPQFLAQDRTGRLLFSTLPTQENPVGTIRVATEYAGGDEVEILRFGTFQVAADNVYGVANVDDIDPVPQTGGNDSIFVYDHIPGTNTQIVAGDTALSLALTSLVGQGSDAFWFGGVWNIDELALQDTTYVAASGDREWVGFGEGASAPVGRVLLWNATSASISSKIQVSDLTHNASERVFGLGLNQGGELLGAVRGAETVYFFDENLALLGQYAEGIAEGASGAALHPSHNSIWPESNQTVAFVGSGFRTIKTVSTVHFDDANQAREQLKEFFIRDELAGPLRAALVGAADPVNSGLTCPGADPTIDPCVVMRLYGVTDIGGVVVVNVRQRDLQ